MFLSQLKLKNSFIFLCLLLAVFFGFNTYVSATNGYFSHGYGIKYMALAGAGVALSLESLGAANNPASMVFLGNRYDISVGFFNPNREYTVTGGPSGFPGTFGLMPGTVESDSRVFIMPSFGANWMITDNISLGLTIYGNGGMNTNYPASTFYGSSPTGVNLAQLFVAPTLAVKVTPDHGLGISPIFCYQYFEAKGLEAFALFSANPNKLTNNKTDSSLGFGVRVGYLGRWTRYLSLGASYQTKIKTGSFADYAGLFAGGGNFDIPANWTLGLAVHPTDAIDLVLDVQRIMYSDVKSVGTPFNPMDFFMRIFLGSPDGPGFGWEDMTVCKSGIQWRSGGGLTWRAGYSFGAQPIPESEVLFNILAPGVVEQHATFGFSKEISGKKEVSLAIMHAFSNSVTGPNPMEVPGLQKIKLRMNQWQLQIGFSF
jgi:long-chain fatty acid transport protein